ncbi:zinc finger MYM-type protein 1-like [Pistacia vera]|uniref:zinc finger MYM-type protein 1-like n=1 Tax=Pistacia vera TaxID=55513 RepID=UPI001263B092|nr:zinc finger MYM-type protein 1-like [Pistacia vera]
MGYNVCNMDKFLKRKLAIDQSSSSVQENKANDKENDPLKESHVELEAILKDLPCDPALQLKINHYHPNYRMQFEDFTCKRVVANLKTAIISQAGSNAFVSEGFCNWKKSERFQIHVGQPNSAHNQARRSCVELMNQKQHIKVALSKQSDQVRIEYRTRLAASIVFIRFLLRQGLAFRGHDETEDSKNQGNFLRLLHFLAQRNEHFKSIVLKNAPGNLKLIALVIQKDIVNVPTNETAKAIISDLGDDIFSVLIDESRDVSIKEQITIAIRYVDKKGHVLEQFLGIVNVSDTTVVSLKMALESLFCKHGLSLSRLRGQGYDGASNMQGEFNGLKSLILRENEYVYYVHYFAHQLQLTLVAIAKNHISVASLFNLVTNLTNVGGGSCKR